MCLQKYNAYHLGPDAGKYSSNLKHMSFLFEISVTAPVLSTFLNKTFL